MPNRVARAVNGVLGRIAPERTLFIRSEGKTRLIYLTPLTQLGLAAAVVAALGWTGFVSTSYLQDSIARQGVSLRLEAMRNARDAELAAIEAERRTLLAARDRLENEVVRLQDRLRDEQRTLVSTRHALEETKLELTATRERAESLAVARAAAEDRVSELEAAVFAGSDTVISPVASIGMSFGPQTESLATVSGAMDSVIAERDEAVRELASLDERLELAEAELAAWEMREAEVMTRLEEAARTSLSGMSQIFERADLDLDRILDVTKRDFTGAGGPFEPLDLSTTDDAADGLRLASLMTDLERVHLMRIAAERLPFAHPAAGARRTSGFGARRDPFSRRWAQHNGLDFAGPIGTPIKAAASGVVVHAGWMRGYGKVVTIKHAFGYETRYAHLSRVHVNRGDHVDTGDRIGSMGSTGRSTGSHLHYEVRLDDKPINPAKFIEAARNVL